MDKKYDKPKEFRGPAQEVFFATATEEPELLLRALIKKLESHAKLLGFEGVRTELQTVVNDINRQDAQKLVRVEPLDEGDEEALLDMNSLRRKLQSIIDSSATSEELINNLKHMKKERDTDREAWRDEVILPQEKN